MLKLLQLGCDVTCVWVLRGRLGTTRYTEKGPRGRTLYINQLTQYVRGFLLPCALVRSDHPGRVKALHGGLPQPKQTNQCQLIFSCSTRAGVATCLHVLHGPPAGRGGGATRKVSKVVWNTIPPFRPRALDASGEATPPPPSPRKALHALGDKRGNSSLSSLQAMPRKRIFSTQGGGGGFQRLWPMQR